MRSLGKGYLLADSKGGSDGTNVYFMDRFRCMKPPKCRCTARKNLEVEGSHDVRSPWICRSLIDAACWRESDQAAADIRPYCEGGGVFILSLSDAVIVERSIVAVKH